VKLRLAHVAVIGALATAFAVSGCGRKGALDPPPGSAAAAQPASSSSRGASINPMAREATPQRSGGGFDEQGRPMGSQGARKPLPMDWLID
jgi:predicted small lipoprotein YifL